MRNDAIPKERIPRLRRSVIRAGNATANRAARTASRESAYRLQTDLSQRGCSLTANRSDRAERPTSELGTKVPNITGHRSGSQRRKCCHWTVNPVDILTLATRKKWT